MKGLQEKSDDGIFLVIKHHCICQESKKPREGFKAVEVTNPRTGDLFTKWMKPYKAVEAMVKKLTWYDTEERYDTRYMGWKLLLDANGTPCTLDIPFQSRVCSRFMKVAENIDFSRPVEFAAWYDAKNDATAFNIRQDGETVAQKYTKEDPGECPPPKQKFGGKWDFDDQKEFLHRRIMEIVIPRVELAAGIEREQEAAGLTGQVIEGQPVDSDEMDDIPF